MSLSKRVIPSRADDEGPLSRKKIHTKTACPTIFPAYRRPPPPRRAFCGLSWGGEKKNSPPSTSDRPRKKGRPLSRKMCAPKMEAREHQRGPPPAVSGTRQGFAQAHRGI